jgi:hypothetical protein
MRTVEERALKIVNDNHSIICQGHTEVMAIVITQALKEQDKITRHACADIVLNQGGRVLNKSVRDDMHRKIMNTKSV